MRTRSLGSQKFFHEHRAIDGSDLYDALYFEDVAYSDVFITNDKGLIRRAGQYRLPPPRIMRADAWELGRDKRTAVVLAPGSNAVDRDHDWRPRNGQGWRVTGRDGGVRS